jgi:LysM repeat protein
LNNGDRQTEIARRSSGDANPDRKQKAESELNNDSNLRQPKPRTVKRGDTLLKIASEFTPNSPEHGLRKILRLNPGSTDLDRIYSGQVIVLSTSDTPNNYEVESAKGGLHYSQYGKCASLRDLKQVMMPLAKKYQAFDNQYSRFGRRLLA